MNQNTDCIKARGLCHTCNQKQKPHNFHLIITFSRELSNKLSYFPSKHNKINGGKSFTHKFDFNAGRCAVVIV